MFNVISERSLAIDSPDHLEPWGTKNDNHSNKKFNEELYKLFTRTPISIMDLGCSGGAFVKDCIDDGHIAIGLEGSDYSFKNKRAEWATIPNNLFVCDISKKFEVFYSISELPLLPFKFDVVTAWEFIEHIKREDLNQVFTNVYNHLKDGGYFIMTVGCHIDGPYHQTVEQPGWWYNKFKEFGWIIRDDLVEYFYSDWVRRPEPPSKIIDGKLVDKNGFHVVLQK